MRAQPPTSQAPATSGHTRMIKTRSSLLGPSLSGGAGETDPLTYDFSAVWQGLGEE